MYSIHTQLLESRILERFSQRKQPSRLFQQRKKTRNMKLRASFNRIKSMLNFTERTVNFRFLMLTFFFLDLPASQKTMIYVRLHYLLFFILAGYSDINAKSHEKKEFEEHLLKWAEKNAGCGCYIARQKRWKRIESKHWWRKERT